MPLIFETKGILTGPDNFSRSGGTVYYLLLSEIPQPENNLILAETNY